MTFKNLLVNNVIPMLVSKYDNVGTGFTIINTSYSKNIMEVSSAPGGYKSFYYYQQVAVKPEVPTLYSETTFTNYFNTFLSTYADIDLTDTEILNSEISPRQLVYVLSAVVKFVTCCTKLYPYIGTDQYVPIFSYLTQTPEALSLPDSMDNEIYALDFNTLENLLDELMLKPAYDATHTDKN